MQRRGRSPSVSIVALRRQEQQEFQTGRLSLVTATPAVTGHSSSSHTTPNLSKPLLAPVAPIILNQQDCVYPPSPSQSPPTSGYMTPVHGNQLFDHEPSESDSLPPPLTLQDQLHVAYALDDIHLAKILLLKLKGIEVTSDSDPRIAAVKPEDFDECFIPAGGLMSPEDEEAIKEMQRAERERLRVGNEHRRRKEREEAEQRRRRDWEVHCEKIWEGEKKRLREEKEFLEKKREEERRKWEEAERRRKTRERETTERRANVQGRYSARSSATKPKLSYASLSTERSGTSSSSSTTTQDKYLYSFMPVPKVPPPPRRRRAVHQPASIDISTSSPSFSNSQPERPNQLPGTSVSTIIYPHDASTLLRPSHPEIEPSSSTMPMHSPSNSLPSDEEEVMRIQSPSVTPRSSNVTVSFRDVLTSMRGPLFPALTEAEGRPRNPCASDAVESQSHSQSPQRRSRSRGQYQDSSMQLLTNAFTPGHQSRRSIGGQSHDARRRKRDDELLAALLVEVRWSEGERMSRGKPLGWDDDHSREKDDQTESRSKEKVTLPSPKPPKPTRQNSSSSIRSTSSRNSSCAACSAVSASTHSSPSPTSPTSSSSSALTRAGSWLSSFSSSTSTAITTPSTSLSTSPVKATIVTPSHTHTAPNNSVKTTVTGWLRKSAIAAAANQQHSKDCQQHHLVHSCHRRPYSCLTPIMPADGPLPLDSDKDASPKFLEAGEDGGNMASGSHNQSNDGDHDAGAASFTRQMSRFVELARGFQTAYINMTVFAAVPTLSNHADVWDREFLVDNERGRRNRKRGDSLRSTVGKRKLRPVGYRASKVDVGQFITVPIVRKEKEVFSRQAQETTETHTSTSLGNESGNHAVLSPNPADGGERSVDGEEEEIVYIPLVSPFPPTYPPKTILPSPLPYTTFFKPPLPVTLSPHRRTFVQQNRQTFEDAMEFGSLSSSPPVSSMKGTGRFSSRLSSSPPPRGTRPRRNGSRSSSHSPTRRSTPNHKQLPPTPAPIPRPRLVANPVFLRLKALKNVGYERGTNWEPSTSNKSCGTLHCGKEKVLALAWDEVGRSSLGCQNEEVNRRQTMIDLELKFGREIDSRRGRYERSKHGVVATGPTVSDDFGSVRRGRCVFRG
ncbi:hypothetical protein VNI00_002294 [Paramarasmius palmivorus]|uniref:Uncharacterized protein n=1 Tax=Paramarasmius palmivorus TaxID=297713 RepID=A0AAW0E177_9AGAR